MPGSAVGTNTKASLTDRKIIAVRPTSTMRVYDAVSDSGIDVSDWHKISSSRSPALPPQ